MHIENQLDAHGTLKEVHWYGETYAFAYNSPFLLHQNEILTLILLKLRKN